MILWVVLFLLVIGISFILALQSMRDYQEIPQKSKVEYGLFLIRRTANFNISFLDNLRKQMIESGLLISLERLFKGKKSVLTIFGPKKILDKFKAELDLLELEDYTLNLVSQDISVWEVGVKDKNKLNSAKLENICSTLPALSDNEQFFWQVVLNPKGGTDSLFQTQMRAALYSEDQAKREALVPVFQALKLGDLVKVPRLFSMSQMLGFYTLRSLGKDSNGPVVDSAALINLLKL